MHEFKHHPHHWNGSSGYNVSQIVFTKALFTLCPPYVTLLTVWNRRTVPVGGGPCGCGHLIPSMLQGRWEEKKSTIGLDTKIRSVFVLIILVTQGALESTESLQREKMRERGRDGVRGSDWAGEGKEGKKGREGSRGERTPGCGWIMRPEAVGVGGGHSLGGAWPFRVQCQVSKPSGQWSFPLSQHRTNMSQSRSVYKSCVKGNPWRKEQPWNQLIICGGLFGFYKNTVLLLLC